jgi:hypothetical protein
LILAALTWASDWITVQNERTVYTADCQGGSWRGAHCTGTLVAGARYRFRALRPHGEVVFWTVASDEPSGKLAPCIITDGRNWTCTAGPDAARTITLQMTHGRPVIAVGSPNKPFHGVSKWRWWLLRGGIAPGQDAEN